MRTVLLLSGGVDSSVLAYHLKNQGREVHGFSVNYGQAHLRELHSAAYVASQACASYEVVDVPSMFAPNALTGGGEDVVVPVRNLIFLSLAYAYAVRIGAEEVAIGVVKNDAERFPDCRPVFMGEFYETIGSALGHKNVPRLRTPFIYKTKREVVEIGRTLGVPFEKTWSCYHGNMEPCGKCLACKDREGALE